MLILEQKIEKYLSTNLAQPYQEWSSTQSYSRNVSVLHKNYIYRNIVHDNLGVDPSINSGKWLLMGVDNAYAGIDLHSHTETIKDDNLTHIELSFSSTGYDYIAFGSIRGSLLTIGEFDSSGLLIKETHHKIGSERTCAIDWYNYFFCSIPDQSNLGRGEAIDYLYGNISPTASSIKITIDENSDKIASIGTMVSGKSKDIGKTQFGVVQELNDYSEKTTDKNGITSIVKRDATEEMLSVIEVPAKQTQIVKRAVKKLLGDVIMIIAEPDKDSNYEHLLLLGYIESFKISITNQVFSIAEMSTVEVI